MLKPVVVRYQGKVSRIYFRADAAFEMPEVYQFLEAERIKYAIRLPANQVLQSRIGYLLTRPVGRPPHHVRRFHANFSYQARTWAKPRKVIAKVELEPGELYPRVGFIVTNMSRPAERVVAFYNKRGTCEQWIKEGKGAIKWTRLWCRTFAANAVRLQLHALAYNLGNFLRTLVAELIKIGAKVVSHGRYVIFQMAEVTADRGATVAAITSASVRRSMSCIQEQPTEGVRANARENGQIRPSTKRSGYRGAASDQHLASVLQEGRENANIDVGLGFIWGISGRYALVWDHVNE
jgi:hypothetical protein